MLWGVPPLGTPRDHQDPCVFLWGTARRQHRVPEGPPGASGGSPHLWLVEDAMQEVNQQGRRTKPLLLGTHLPPSIFLRTPLPSGRERRRVSKRTLSFAGRSRAFL